MWFHSLSLFFSYIILYDYLIWDFDEPSIQLWKISVSEMLFDEHGWYAFSRFLVNVKRSILGQMGIKLFLPVALEVDCIHQYHLCIRVDFVCKIASFVNYLAYIQGYENVHYDLPGSITSLMRLLVCCSHQLFIVAAATAGLLKSTS